MPRLRTIPLDSNLYSNPKAGLKLKLKRVAACKSQTQLALAMGVGQRYVSLLEQGRSVSKSAIEKYLKALTK